MADRDEDDRTTSTLGIRKELVEMYPDNPRAMELVELLRLEAQPPKQPPARPREP